MGFKLAILISGNGSNMLNIIEACKKKILSSEVKIVVSNNYNSKGIELAKKKEIKTKIIDNEKFEEKLQKILHDEKINLVCLAGFMKILNKKFLKNWKYKIINIHPSILPSFPGLNAVDQALKKGVKYTGCTIHFVDDGIDTGKIIDQKIIRIAEKDTLSNLKKKILKEEHNLYIKVLSNLEKEINDKI
tara:strand:- start:2576 stop:3142 length:567 start_codon:yes stop_codon:yes gene_type:complete